MRSAQMLVNSRSLPAENPDMCGNPIVRYRRARRWNSPTGASHRAQSGVVARALRVLTNHLGCAGSGQDDDRRMHLICGWLLLAMAVAGLPT